MRCREFDFFKILRTFWEIVWNFFWFLKTFLGIFLEDFFGRIFLEELFGRNFLGGIFFEDLFKMIFLGGFFGGFFWEDFFGGIFREDFGRIFLEGILCLYLNWHFVKILVLVKILSQSRRKEGKNFISLEVRVQAYRT